MKTNKRIAILLCLVMMLGILTACGQTAEQPIGMPNPMKEVSAEEMAAATGLSLAAPEGASDIKYFTINDTTAQVDFTLDGKEYTYRAEPTDKLEAYDLSGLFYTWSETAEGNVGGLTAVVEACDKAGAVYWLDVAPGLAYSLGCNTAVTADELLSIANACFAPVQGEVSGEEPEPPIGMPNPVKELSAEEMGAVTGLYLTAPEGASDVKYFTIADKTAQVVFNLGGKEYTYRAEPTAELEAYDFSGIYCDWTETSEGEVAYLTATVKISDDTDATAYWLDIVPGIAYSLSCEPAVEADEILRVANLCFIPTQGDADGDPFLSSAFYMDNNASEGGNMVTLGSSDDGYDVNVSIYRLTQMDGKGTVDGNTLNMTLTDPNGGEMKASFTIEDDATYTLTITESTWDLLETGTVFPGFIACELLD